MKFNLIWHPEFNLNFVPRRSYVDKNFLCVCLSLYIDVYLSWVLTILPTSHLIIFLPIIWPLENFGQLYFNFSSEYSWFSVSTWGCFQVPRGYQNPWMLQSLPVSLRYSWKQNGDAEGWLHSKTWVFSVENPCNSLSLFQSNFNNNRDTLQCKERYLKLW